MSQNTYIHAPTGELLALPFLGSFASYVVRSPAIQTDREAAHKTATVFGIVVAVFFWWGLFWVLTPNFWRVAIQGHFILMLLVQSMLSQVSALGVLRFSFRHFERYAPKLPRCWVFSQIAKQRPIVSIFCDFLVILALIGFAVWFVFWNPDFAQGNAQYPLWALLIVPALIPACYGGFLLCLAWYKRYPATETAQSHPDFQRSQGR